MPVCPKSLLSVVLLALSSPSWAAKKVDLDYHVRFLPESDQAEVRLTLERGEAVTSLDFDLSDKGYYSDFQADGQWQPNGDSRGVWLPAKARPVSATG
jgi:hypothetical protein